MWERGEGVRVDVTEEIVAPDGRPSGTNRPPGSAPLKDLAAAHALGALSNAEAAEVERELVRLDEVAAELASYREVAAELAKAIPPARPPADLRQRVLARVRQESQSRLNRVSTATKAPATRATTSKKPLLVVGLLALLVVAAAAWFVAKGQRDVAAAKAQVAALQFLRDSINARLQYREKTLDQILTPGTTIYELTGGPQGNGQVPVVQVIWVQGRTHWLVNARRLPPAPAGKSYQLWYLVNGQTISANVFNTDTDGHAFFSLEVPAEAARVTQAIVTLEPEGGSPAPTAPALLSGAVSQ
jgi:anti-sigma-K factor RskA